MEATMVDPAAKKRGADPAVPAKSPQNEDEEVPPGAGSQAGRGRALR